IKEPNYISAACLKMYFEGNPPANQFLCRAYLCQGQLKSPPATGNFEEAVMYFLKAIEISKQEPRYHFMVFNASVLYFQTVRPLLRPGQRLHLVPSFRQVVQSLEEVADQDHSWRAELMILLYCSVVNCINYVLSGICRVAFLLELALLALQVKHQKVAADCLKELKLAREAVSVRYSFKTSGSSVARLKEIGKLDKWLQTAVREGDPEAVQAVCATQWRFCLPLLQHNLRKCIKTPLLKVVQALEDMQSMLLEMRCQVHSELAVIEEEEGRLEASLTQLQKAMLLDNGAQRERLSSALRLLQLRGTLFQTPSRTEDKAAMLMQQARDMEPKDKTDTRPILVAVGLLLSPDDFQMVLDGDNPSTSSLGSGPVAQLSAKAQHHSTSLQKVDGHLVRQSSDTDNTERMKLWATLVKTARRQEVWDVCRAACRFCLLYDDGRWKISKADSREINVLCLAQATVQKLLTEGVQLNSPAVPPQEQTRFSLSLFFPTLHCTSLPPSTRNWIQALSAYATSNFLRAAELGSEIREPWVVGNAAIYLWNYSSHLLAAGEYQCLFPPFQILYIVFLRNRALVVLLCDAVARGLIQPLCGPESVEEALQGDKSKSRAEKGMEKAATLCDYALHISNCSIQGEAVPIAARKQVVATWVQIKRLLQQQIGSKIDTKDEEVSAMTRVLIGVEMLQCNRNPSMASECSWTDAVVEMQVWSQLAAFCHYAKEHSLVLCCTKSALQLEEAAAKSLNTMPCVLNLFFFLHSLNLLLLICLLSSLAHSYAEKAKNPALCVTAARHYWNTCLLLTHTPEERWQLQDPLERILNALVHTTTKHANVKIPIQPHLYYHIPPYKFWQFFMLVSCLSRRLSFFLDSHSNPIKIYINFPLSFN
uniref:Cilia and flagella associated protein 46 n=1 Tax=Seriola lalandi dorsalis TaxID=1841481 RepID=A0A3B4YJ43_SERLL